MSQIIWAVTLALFAFVVPARADIIVQELEFRPGIGERPGVIFGRLTHQGAVPDQLIAVESPDARIELHTHELQGNVMRMRRVTGFSLAPGEDLLLTSGGHHLMVFDLLRNQDKTPLRLTFRFENAPAVTTDIAVPAKAEAMRHHHH